MLRRIAPWLLALAVAAAPVALELCHIACTSPASPSDTGARARSHPAHTASCHDAAESPAPLSLHAHPCDHGDDLPTPAGLGSARQSKFGASQAAAIPAIDRIAVTRIGTPTRLRSRGSDPSAARVDLFLPLRI